jgi:hypothetical protein
MKAMLGLESRQRAGPSLPADEAYLTEQSRGGQRLRQRSKTMGPPEAALAEFAALPCARWYREQR